MGALARIQKILSGVSGHGPVVMLAGAIYTRKWFFMEKASESHLLRHSLGSLHHKLVMVCSNVILIIDRGQFMLSRSCLIVLCLGRDSKLAGNEEAVKAIGDRVRKAFDINSSRPLTIRPVIDVLGDK